MITDKTIRRFWAELKTGAPDECWEWQGCKDAFGYGLISQDGVSLRVHRVSYAIENPGFDPMPKPRHMSNRSDYIRHRCDNPGCGNPGHLRPGTKAQNSGDMVERGRQNSPIGTRNRHAKINEDAVRDIRASAVDLEGECAMMLKYRIGQLQVKMIYTRKSWAWVE